MGYAHIIKAALIALPLALAACGKQAEEPTASAPASAPAFPAGKAYAGMTTGDCDKLPDPKPADDSAASRGVAAARGEGARAACKREVAASAPNADLARIREIKENEEAERVNRNVSEEEWRQAGKEGAKKPIKKYTY